MGKQATFIVPNKLPEYLKWLKGCDSVVVYEEQKLESDILIDAAQLFIMLDFNSIGRLSDMGNKISTISNEKKILIDHHPYPDSIAELMYSRTSSSSTCELVYEFIDKLYGDLVITKDIAECIFLGIMTDTGSFSYNSSNPYTFNVISNLLAKGIDKNYIADKVYSNFSEYRMRLLGYALSTKMKVINKYKTAYIYLTQKELDEYHFEIGDTEGFVNYPLSIKGIIFTAFFVEKEGVTKCSFRSKGKFPANLVAKDYFSGGGHLNAAGGENKASIEDTIIKFEKVLSEYEEYL
jgi:phosphoesterase RecJ-like protein